MVMYDLAYETVYKENTTLTRSCLLRYGNVSRVEFFEFCLLFFFFFSVCFGLFFKRNSEQKTEGRSV